MSQCSGFEDVHSVSIDITHSPCLAVWYRQIADVLNVKAVVDVLNLGVNCNYDFVLPEEKNCFKISYKKFFHLATKPICMLNHYSLPDCKCVSFLMC